MQRVMARSTSTVLILATAIAAAACEGSDCDCDGPCDTNNGECDGGGDGTGQAGSNWQGRDAGSRDTGIFAPSRPGCDGLRYGPCAAVNRMELTGPGVDKGNPQNRSVYRYVFSPTITITGALPLPEVALATTTITRYIVDNRIEKDEVDAGSNNMLNEVWTYVYDDQNRLEQMTGDTYDDMNLDGKMDDLKLFMYDARGRLQSWELYKSRIGDEGTTFEDRQVGNYTDWDESGNPTELVVEHFVYTYQYDASCNLMAEQRWSRSSGERTLEYSVEFDYSCW